jgi:hypothetical protein
MCREKLVSETHFTVTWCNTLLSSAVTTIKHAVRYTQDILHNRNQFWLNGHEIHTQRYCDMHGNSYYMILVDVKLKLKCFHYCSSICVRQEVPHLRHINQSMKVPLLKLWNENTVESHAISHENRNYPNRGSWNCFLEIKWIHNPSRGTQVFYKVSSSTHVLQETKRSLWFNNMTSCAFWR